ncbi:VTT domain-containing protein [Lysinibacillus sp. NPDC094403]|uniref:VTT domain-containing protein n=1 Tax=Lysinibacillus sp. NPDC094403 TaxID=3390581 RepID=UPI003D08DB6B
MELIKELINFIMHIDVHLEEIIHKFGNLSYFVLFAIVFVETGVVIFPFLPGDSLLFASGTLAAAMGAFDMWILIPVFLAAAILGDTMNYHIGHKVGTSIPPKSFLGRVVKKERMEAAEKFFNKHGGKTIVIARFMPFIRTFIPFVAGASKMKYSYFIMYNVLGAVLWVLSCTLLGYFFGNIPIIKDNFSTVLILIILLSVVPAVVGAIKAKASGK